MFKTCGPCEPTCDEPWKTCDNRCGPAGCYCRPDFARTESNMCAYYYPRKCTYF